MSIGLVTRFGYGMSIAVLALSIAALARAEDAPPTSRDAPTAMPTARKSGAPGGRAETPASSSVAEQHRLPPDSTTQHTLSLPRRTPAAPRSPPLAPFFPPRPPPGLHQRRGTLPGFRPKGASRKPISPIPP